MRQHSGALRSELGKPDGICDPQALCLPSSRSRIRRRGDEQSGVSMTAAEDGDGFDEVFPALVRIEVACIQTDLRIRRDFERRPGLALRHSIGDCRR